MRWEAAPKPRLTDASYKAGFLDEFDNLSVDEQIERVRRNDLGLSETEPLFDGADIARFGRDLFVQLSLVTNRGGYRWVRQHIDATWVPLRPGLVLHCGERKAQEDLLLQSMAFAESS